MQANTNAVAIDSIEREAALRAHEFQKAENSAGQTADRETSPVGRKKPLERLGHAIVAWLNKEEDRVALI